MALGSWSRRQGDGTRSRRTRSGRLLASAAAGCAVAALVAAASIAPASIAPATAAPGAHGSGLTGAPLVAAKPRVASLTAAPATAPIALDAGLADWHGRPAHLAGTAHYDRGEWIYENYPFTAYGAAIPGLSVAFGLLDQVVHAVTPAERVPGGLDEFAPTTGAGPFVPQADLSELRFTVRGSDLYVLARTTTMQQPVQTALLLLFDASGVHASRTVPFGSGLRTTAADTAVLVTAAGAHIVDLRTGRTTTAPAAADPAGYDNSLVARLPLAQVGGSHGASLRVVGATGVVAPGSYTLTSPPLEGPLAEVVPRFDEPVRATYDHLQALALADHDIDRYFTTVSVDRLRRGDSEQLLPGVGYSVRTIEYDTPTSSEGGTNGTLRDYGLYVPVGFDGRPSPATLVLRGSGMTPHSLASITPGLFQELGDDNHAIVVSPGGRSDLDEWSGAAYLDADRALDDAEALLPIDRDRVTVAGYSMGGFGTYLFASTQPDRFAAGFVIEGPVGGNQPATTTTGLPDVVPNLVNVRATPIEIYQGDIDANVPITNGLAAADQLEALGYRYRLDILPGNTHFTPGILNDYRVGADFLRGARRDTAPAEVHFSRIMPFEHAVDQVTHTDAPGIGKSAGLRFDHAWFVHDLEAVDPAGGTASIDVRTFARPGMATNPEQHVGVAPGTPGGELPSLYQEQVWQPTLLPGAARNALDARLTGTRAVTLDLAGMALTATAPLTATVRTSSPATITFTGGGSGCASVSIDDGPRASTTDAANIVVAVPAGTHTIRLQPGTCTSQP